MYVSSTGTIHVVGEVLNGRASGVGFVKVTANFFSSGGALLATDFGFATLDRIPAGGDSPFEILVLSPPAGITTFSASVSDYASTATAPPVDLQASVSNTFVSSIGTLHLVGTVRNASSSTYDFVQPIVALYDAAGRVSRVDFTFTSPSLLGPGQSASFEALVLDAPAYSAYRLWVDGSISNKTPSATGLEIRKTSSRSSSFGTLYVFGEVVNRRPSAVRIVKITANFYSSSGVLLVTDFTYASVSVIPAGGDSPFRVLLFSPPDEIASFTLEVTEVTDAGALLPVSGLTTAVTNTYTTSFGSYHIVGQATNTTGASYKSVEVIAALYDASGAMVDLDSDYLSPSTLGPASSVAFDVVFFDPPSFSSYRLWVDADR